MKQVLFVGLGGFIGSVARYKLGGVILHQSLNWRFPLSTFCVNVLGCFLLGALAGLAERESFLGADARLFLFTGLLGGFTTFSAFGVEGLNLIRRGDITMAAVYALVSIVCGIGAVAVGMKLLGLPAAS
ncbi:fluoride efflux transporter CrcB [soil metagenome]